MSPPLSKSETNLRFLNGGDMGEVFGGWGGMNLLQGAAVALFWWVEVGTTRGSRPAGYAPAKGVTIKPYQAKGGIVGNDP